MSQKADVSYNSYVSYENGRHLPSLDIALKIAKSQNVSVDWLATGEGSMHSTSNRVSKQDKELMASIIKKLKNLINELDDDDNEIRPDKFAELCFHIYTQCLEDTSEEHINKEIDNVIYLAKVMGG